MVVPAEQAFHLMSGLDTAVRLLACVCAAAMIPADGAADAAGMVAPAMPKLSPTAMVTVLSCSP